MTSRDEFTLATKRMLAERAGFQCSFPGCEAVTIGASEDAPNASVSVGEAAHICAAAPGGPRFDSGMTRESRSSIENGIWVCRTHAALIDRDITTYPAQLLREWKLQAEHRSRMEVGRQRGQEPGRQSGSRLTTVRSPALTCSIKKLATEEIQNQISVPQQVEGVSSFSVILPAESELDWGSDSYFWRHLGHFCQELTIATFQSEWLQQITVEEFLSECYHRFLAGIVEPYSYGSSWVVTSLGWGATEILAPWDLLKGRFACQKRRGGPEAIERDGIRVWENEPLGGSLQHRYSDWSKLTLAEAAVLDRRFWVIREPQSLSIFGAATQIRDRAWFMRRVHPESWKALLSGYPDIPRSPHPYRQLPSFVEFPRDLEGKRMISIDPAEPPFCQFEYQIIFENPWWRNKDGCAFVVSDEHERSLTSDLLGQEMAEG